MHGIQEIQNLWSQNEFKQLLQFVPLRDLCHSLGLI